MNPQTGFGPFLPPEPETAETDYCLLITVYCFFPRPEPESRRNPLSSGPRRRLANLTPLSSQ
jgi:hypothetical protein